MARSGKLFTAHPLLLQTAYSELKRLAGEQRVLLIGTPGSVSEREVKGSRFLYRQYYDAIGEKRADYIGPCGDLDAMARADLIREQITLAGQLANTARLLFGQGYVRADDRVCAILASDDPAVTEGFAADQLGEGDIREVQLGVDPQVGFKLTGRGVERRVRLRRQRQQLNCPRLRWRGRRGDRRRLLEDHVNVGPACAQPGDSCEAAPAG